MSEFKREDRYLVFKYTDIDKLNDDEQIHLNALIESIHAIRFANGNPILKAVVVESDWPGYEPTWEAIEKRMGLTNE